MYCHHELGTVRPSRIDYSEKVPAMQLTVPMQKKPGRRIMSCIIMFELQLFAFSQFLNSLVNYQSSDSRYLIIN